MFVNWRSEFRYGDTFPNDNTVLSQSESDERDKVGMLALGEVSFETKEQKNCLSIL
jgi:hypothetical protein